MQGQGVVERLAVRAGKQVAAPPVLPPEPAEACSSCGRIIGRLEQPFIFDDSIVCFGCHKHLTDGGNETAPDSVSERVFFRDRQTTITRDLVMLDGHTHSLAELRFARLQTVPGRRAIGGVIAAIGIAVTMAGVNRHLDATDWRILMAGVVTCTLGILVMLLARSKYRILLTTDEGEHVAMCSRNRKYTRRVIDAIAEAIVERGSRR